MVNDKLIEIWKRKAAEGDEHAKEKLREIVENTEHLAPSPQHLYNNKDLQGSNCNTSGKRNRKSKYPKYISLRIERELLEKVELIVKKWEHDSAEVSSQRRSHALRYLISKGIECELESLKKEESLKSPVEYSPHGGDSVFIRD